MKFFSLYEAGHQNSTSIEPTVAHGSKRLPTPGLDDNLHCFLEEKKKHNKRKTQQTITLPLNTRGEKKEAAPTCGQVQQRDTRGQRRGSFTPLDRTGNELKL